MKYNKADVQESLSRLRKLCPPGTTVFCTLRHVSRSGMQRQISLHVVKKGEMVSISWDAARVLGWSLNDGRAYWAIKADGCGQDMGFHTVHCLSYALHGMKDRGDGIVASARGVSMISKTRRGHFRAGYSLNQRWV